MSEKKNIKTAVIFGGAGFIGRYFSVYLINAGIVEKVIVVDINNHNKFQQLKESYSNNEVEYFHGDVRDKINLDLDKNSDVQLIVNLAAVHREPGHLLEEYYDTNLLGAKNVCGWAESVGCNNIVFTSSIAPYGPTEKEKNELAIPAPVTAYGGSKLAAEKIHETWQARDEAKRKLVIVRPGVVFGAGEGGNVSRLIKAVVNRYFFYMGNKNTTKAGTYVKELCNAMWWVLRESPDGVTVFNMSMNPGPTVEEYVDMICKVSGIKRFVPNVPFFILYPISYIVDPVSKLFKINQPISPVRLRKLVKSNNIIPQKLVDLDYKYQFTFEEAMSDWRKDDPSEWK